MTTTKLVNEIACLGNCAVRKGRASHVRAPSLSHNVMRQQSAVCFWPHAALVGATAPCRRLLASQRAGATLPGLAGSSAGQREAATLLSLGAKPPRCSSQPWGQAANNFCMIMQCRHLQGCQCNMQAHRNTAACTEGTTTMMAHGSQPMVCVGVASGRTAQQLLMRDGGRGQTELQDAARAGHAPKLGGHSHSVPSTT